MKEKLKKCSIINVILFLLLFFYSLPTIAIQNIVNQTNNEYVNEDNTFDISEYITTQFNVSKHGIIRDLPLKNNIVRLNGITSYNSAKISNIKVSEKYTTEHENNMLRIKIGGGGSSW